MQRWRDVRGIALFTLGVGLTIWDLVIFTPGTAEPAALLFYGALMGVEFVLRGDEKRRNGNGKNGHE